MSEVSHDTQVQRTSALAKRVRGAFYSSWRSWITIMLATFSGLEISYAALKQGLLDSKWQYLGLLVVVAIIGLAALFQSWRGWKRQSDNSMPDSHVSDKVEASTVSWVGLALLVMTFPVLLMGPWGIYLEFYALRLLAFWLYSLVGALLWQRARPGLAAWVAHSGSAIAIAAVYQIAIHLPLISSYPLAMGWSETSRFYYGSLFFAQQLYGVKTALSVLHPSRYLLQAVPFLFSSESLLFHRAWQVLLWLGMSLLASWSLKRRLRFRSRWMAIFYILWAFLFLFQGPIIYHLLVPVIVIFLGHHSARPIRSLLIVVLASAWAGISRINWIPVPAMLAITLYMLETEQDGRSLFNYLRWPFIWGVVGSLIALFSQYAYMTLSGNSLTEFGSSLSSDLLWYRLLPNPTFPPGILLAALLASAPIFGAIWISRDRWRQLSPIRWLGMAAMLAVLGLGGIIVSLKIGGGSNLHNLDSYLILLLVIGSYLLAGQIGGPSFESRLPRGLPRELIALAVAVPLFFTLSVGGVFHPPDRTAGQRVVAEIQAEIDRLPDNPQVLFIGERHLLTFGRIKGVELIPRYERVFLMEMAMGNTEPYLSTFRDELAQQTFDLIISDPLKIQYQGRGRAFGEENDTWVERVSIPVLCYYEPVRTFERAPVQILAPRDQAPQCPVESN